MKLLIASFSIFIFFQFSAADKEFTKTMSAALEKINGINSAEIFRERGDTFLKIAGDYKNEWLPLYYAGYNYLSAAEYYQDPASKIRLWQKAEKAIADAKEISRDNSELFSLEALLHLNRSKGLSNFRSQNIDEKIEQIIKQALSLDAKNPRAHLVAAINLLNGNKQQEARKEAQTALALFENKTPKLYPAWGKNLAISLSKKL